MVKDRMRCAAVHPGQGAQSIGMALDFHQASPAVRQLFSLASDTAGKDLFRLLETGTEEELRETGNTQLAVALASRAALIRAEELGFRTVCTAGFSLGELPALVCAGVLGDEALFSILVERGRCMARAVEMLKADGTRLGMSAIIGLGFERLQEIVKEENVEGIYCANDNSPTQVVLAGNVDKIDLFAKLLAHHGVRRVIPLKVSGPFHTPLMDQAVEPFAAFLEKISFSDPVLPLVSSVSGEWVKEGKDARHNCAVQLTSPVRWTGVMERLREKQQGFAFDCLLETGPGKVLSGLWGRDQACPAYPGGTEAALQEARRKENE